MIVNMELTWEEREEIGRSLGIVKCDHCLRLCPFCPRLLAVRPDLASPLPISEPSLLQKAANFGRAITQHLAAGLPHTDEATVARRLSICQVCEYFDATRTACRKCGCYMEVKVKWAEQKCPIGKW